MAIMEPQGSIQQSDCTLLTVNFVKVDANQCSMMGPYYHDSFCADGDFGQNDGESILRTAKCRNLDEGKGM